MSKGHEKENFVNQSLKKDREFCLLAAEKISDIHQLLWGKSLREKAYQLWRKITKYVKRSHWGGGGRCQFCHLITDKKKS